MAKSFTTGTLGYPIHSYAEARRTVYFGTGCSATESNHCRGIQAMVQPLTGEDYEEFVQEKRAAAVHFDAEWDVGYRPITRQKMQEAEQVLAQEVNFGEIEVDREFHSRSRSGSLAFPPLRTT